MRLSLKTAAVAAAIALSAGSAPALREGQGFKNADAGHGQAAGGAERPRHLLPGSRRQAVLFGRTEANRGWPAVSRGACERRRELRCAGARDCERAFRKEDSLLPQPDGP